MNKIILMGRLAHDPEMKRTPNDNYVCNMTIAVNRSIGEGADFIDCVAWKKTAELISKHFRKGNNILIEGSLQSRKWSDKSGNKRVAWEVLVDRVYFVESKKKSDDQKDNFSQFEEVVDADDGTLPF